jgi:uncharacterized protein (TIGR03437 family)
VAQAGLFSPALYGFNLGGPQAVAVNGDGTVTAPAGSIPGVSCHPAVAGDVLLLYASGLGPVEQPPPDGVNSLDALRRTTNPLQVRIGGASADVPFSGLSPQFTGVYQVNVVVPPGATGDAVPVQLLIGGVTSADTLTVALQ